MRRRAKADMALIHSLLGKRQVHSWNTSSALKLATRLTSDFRLREQKMHLHNLGLHLMETKSS